MAKKQESRPPAGVLEQPLPSNPEAETAVLGAVLLSRGASFARADAILSPDDFFLEKHRRIWAAMAEIHEDGEPIDSITLHTRLLFRGQLEAVGGIAYISELTVGAVDVDVTTYCRLIREASERRRIIFLAHTAMGMAQDGFGEPAEQIAAHVVSEMLTVGHRASTTHSWNQIIVEFPGGVNRLLSPSTWDKGIATGFTKLDEMMTGFHPQELIILAARPSMGKTAMALGMGAHAAKAGKHVLMFSLEMNEIAILHRLVCSEARVDLHRFRGGYLQQDERLRLSGALAGIRKWDFQVNDTAGATIEQIRAECSRAQVEHGAIDLLIVDYLGLVGTKAKTQNRNDEVTKISAGLKQLARDLKAPVLALSQLNRSSDQRKEKPRLSDLRDSGSLEQDADAVLFIYREEVYKPDREDLHGLAEVIVAKQRNGPTGTVDLAFIHKYTRFENRASDLGEEWSPGLGRSPGLGNTEVVPE